MRGECRHLVSRDAAAALQFTNTLIESRGGRTGKCVTIKNNPQSVT